MKPFIICWCIFVVVGIASFYGAAWLSDHTSKDCSWCQPNQPMYGAQAKQEQ